MSVKRILLAEDNEVAREGLCVVLCKEGYEVTVAANGQEALDQLQSGPRPDLIILDMLMPVLDGWQFLQRLRRQQPRPGIPVIVATSTVLTREWATDNGCQGFLHKPIEAQQLIEEVRRCLATTGASPG